MTNAAPNDTIRILALYAGGIIIPKSPSSVGAKASALSKANRAIPIPLRVVFQFGPIRFIVLDSGLLRVDEDDQVVRALASFLLAGAWQMDLALALV